MGAAGKSAGGILGKAIGVAAGGALLAAGLGKGLYEIGQSFNDMNNTIIVGTGASGKVLDGLESSAKRLGETVPSSFADIGTAVADLNTRTGATGKGLEILAAKELNLARITKTDLSANIADTTRMFGDWGIAIRDQPKALDELFYASQATGAGINDLAQSVVRMGAPLRQFGFSFEEGLAIFGKWEKEGVNAQTVMAGLKIGLGQFSKAGLEPKKALEDVSKAIMDAGSAGEANQLAIKAFGQRAGPDMAAAIREGRFAIDDLVKGIKGSGGSIADADKRTRTFSQSWQLFKNNVMLTLAPIAERVFSGFTDFAATALPKVTSGFKSVSTAVGSFVADFKSGVGVGGEFASAFSGIGAVLAPLGKFMLNNKATVLAFVGTILAAAAAIKVTTIAVALFNAVVAANPISLIVIGLAALVAGLVYAYTHFETFRNVVDAVFGFLKTAVTATIGFVKDHWQLIVAIILGPIGIVAVQVIKHWSAIKSFVTTAVSTIINFVRDHWRLIITIIGGPLGLAVALVTKYWSQIKAATIAVWNAVKSVVSTQINAAKAVVSTAIGVIQAAFGKIGDLVGKVRGWFGDILSAIKSKLGEAVDFVKGFPGKVTSALSGIGSALYSKGRELIQGLINGIKSMAGSIGDAIKSVIPHVPGLHIPGLATGGRVTAGQPYLVGENGPELFASSRAGYIVPNHKLSAASAGSMSDNAAVLAELRALRAAVGTIAPGVVGGINGAVSHGQRRGQ